MASRKSTKYTQPVKLFDPTTLTGTSVTGKGPEIAPAAPSSGYDFDDSFMPKARNVIEWIVGAAFLKTSVLVKQAEVLVKLFCDYCPGCSDQEYLAQIPVHGMEGMPEFQAKICLLEHGKCPKCHKNRLQIFDFENNKSLPCELVAVWGQRSGKSVTAASLAATYELHRYLKVPNIAKYFGQIEGQQFDMTFTALTQTQAVSTLWTKFYGAYKASPWFRLYNKSLKKHARLQGEDPDKFFKVRDTYIWYGGTKNIRAECKPSDLRSLRGDTRIWATIDELGWFGTGQSAVRANAHEVYASLSNSLKTMKAAAIKKWAAGDYDSPTAIMCNISSPSSQFDAIMTKLKEGATDNTKVCSHLATWECNPDYTIDSFRVEAANDRVKFLRDFGAVPPLGSETFIGSEKNLERTPDASLKSLFRYAIIHPRDKVDSGASFVAAKILDCVPEKLTPRILCVDAGETNNSFCIGMYHAEEVQLPGEGQQRQTTIFVDGVLEVSPEHPTKDDTIPVHFPSMFECIVQLVDKFNVQYVVWDRWQSTGEIQRLRDKKVKAERYSPKYNDFLLLRNMVYAGRIKAPKAELKNLSDLDIHNAQAVQMNPWSHFYVQLATVRESGHKVTKPLSGEDDMFRTLVLAVAYFNDPDIAKHLVSGALGARSTFQGSSQKVGSVSLYGSSLGRSSSSSLPVTIGSVKLRTKR
jgi:hypothetical protein